MIHTEPPCPYVIANISIAQTLLVYLWTPEWDPDDTLPHSSATSQIRAAVVLFLGIYLKIDTLSCSLFPFFLPPFPFSCSFIFSNLRKLRSSSPSRGALSSSSAFPPPTQRTDAHHFHSRRALTHYSTKQRPCVSTLLFSRSPCALGRPWPPSLESATRASTILEDTKPR